MREANAQTDSWGTSTDKSTDMEVSAQALRIYYTSWGKLHSSRIQRGGQRLHRSLMLIQMIESSTDLYYSALAIAQSGQRVADNPAETFTAASNEDERKETMEACLAISQ
ncbi:immediate early response gene 2 protein-like [Syngnathus typhle]|uniref:immediate early response gene 2 protein-like n=1 Tax=Syngnathus typhle TaxID=161592 RepID=UPI002A6B786D|nr:immediate early response gene 2 protein-like [Syngnathus typhle]